MQNNKRNNATDFGRKSKVMSERIFFQKVRREDVIIEWDKRGIMKEKRKINKRREEMASD